MYGAMEEPSESHSSSINFIRCDCDEVLSKQLDDYRCDKDSLLQDVDIGMLIEDLRGNTLMEKSATLVRGQ